MEEQDVKLYPEEDEPINILNIKRGIVSALMVPDIDETKFNGLQVTTLPVSQFFLVFFFLSFLKVKSCGLIYNVWSLIFFVMQSCTNKQIA